MDQEIKWPQKTREMQQFCIDSTYWNGFEFRDDDIVIATWAKSGTTWLQQIVAQWIFDGETEGMPVGDMSPWLDFRLPPLEVKLPGVIEQKHRRFLKTHLPRDAYPYPHQVKHIYIGRDGRDACMSVFNHHKYMLPWVYEELHKLPYFGPVIEPPRTEDLREYFLDWFHEDGFPFWPYWENIRTWWEARDLPNMYFLHYQNLKDDMEGEMLKIGKFLGYDKPDQATWDKMVLHCTFDYMKKNATASTPLGGSLWEGGADTFVHKGTNGRWKDALTPEDIAMYEKRAVEELGEDCAYWLATGNMKDGSDPNAGKF